MVNQKGHNHDVRDKNNMNNNNTMTVTRAYQTEKLRSHNKLDS